MMGFVHIMIILTDAVIITCLLSCTKKSEKYPASPDRRDQFIGRYKVIDANPKFEYEITKVDSNDKKTYIRIHNFANLFNMLFRVDQSASAINALPFPGYGTGNPIKDKFDNRWTFLVYGNTNIPDNYRLHEDTLRVYFRIQNAPWYVDDDTTGIDKYYLQTAVKIK